MTNFLITEMAKLFQQGLSFPKAIFVGRICYGRLDEDTRVRMEFAAEGVADQYSALKVTLLNRKEGPIDSILLSFSDVLGKKPTTNPNFQEGIVPHIWKNRNTFAWYVYQPTAVDYKITKYLQLLWAAIQPCSGKRKWPRVWAA